MKRSKNVNLFSLQLVPLKNENSRSSKIDKIYRLLGAVEGCSHCQLEDRFQKVFHFVISLLPQIPKV